MKAARLIAMAALGGIAWAAQAEAPAPAAPTPQQIVAARQAGFSMSAATMAGLSAALAGTAPVKAQAFPARGLAKWAAAMPALFPEATASVTPSRAKPAIWQNRADFDAKAADFAKAAAALAAAAAADDKDAYAAALASTAAACKACHDSYQAPPPAPRAG